MTESKPTTLAELHEAQAAAMAEDGARFVPVDSVAERYSVSTRTIWRWTDLGLLPAPIKIGGTTRWSLQALAEWEENLTGPGMVFLHERDERATDRLNQGAEWTPDAPPTGSDLYEGER